MENFKWRSNARIVAWLDLVLSGIGLILLIILATIFVQDNFTAGSRSEPNFVLKAQVILWVSLAIGAVLACISIWAAILLLKATDEGSDRKRALNGSRIWRNVSVVFLVISIIANITSNNYFGLIIGVIIRGAMIYNVIKFIHECEDAAPASFSNPNAIVVKQ